MLNCTWIQDVSEAEIFCLASFKKNYLLHTHTSAVKKEDVHVSVGFRN